MPKRLKNHRRDLLKNTHRNRHLQNAVNKYGIENFRFELRDEIAYLWDLKSISKEERITLKKALRRQLLDREQIWLDADESYEQEKGYNICLVAESRLGLQHKQESIEKMRKNRRGKCVGLKHSEEWKQHQSEGILSSEKYQKAINEDWKEKISHAHTGSKDSDKTRKIKSDAQKVAQIHQRC